METGHGHGQQHAPGDRPRPYRHLLGISSKPGHDHQDRRHAHRGQMKVPAVGTEPAATPARAVSAMLGSSWPGGVHCDGLAVAPVPADWRAWRAPARQPSSRRATGVW
jgi:hypothetical protein